MNEYEILGVPKNVTIPQLKKQYRIKVLKYHPDRNNGNTTEMFKKIVQAYETILKEIQIKPLDTLQRRSRFYSEQFSNTNRTEYSTTGSSYTFTFHFR